MRGLKDADLFRTRYLVGGAWVDAADGATIEVIDPATGTALGTVPDVSGAETHAAIAAASDRKSVV